MRTRALLFASLIIASSMISFKIETEAATADDWAATNWNYTITYGAGTASKIYADANYVYIGDGSQNIIAVDRATGTQHATNATGEYLITSIDGDGTYIYVGCKNTSTGSIKVIKYDSNLTKLAEYYNTSFYFCTVSYDNGYVYVAGGDNSNNGYIVQLYATNLTETGVKYTVAQNILFFEGVFDTQYAYFAYRYSTTDSGVMKFYKTNLTKVANWSAGANYDFRNIILCGNTLITSTRKQIAGTYYIYALTTNLTEVWNISVGSVWDLAAINSTFFISSHPQDATNIITKRYVSNATVVWSYTGFDNGSYYMAMVYDDYLYAYGSYGGVYILRNITVSNATSPPLPSYTPVSPPSSSEWDAPYHNMTLVSNLFNISLLPHPDGNINAARWSLVDRDPYTNVSFPSLPATITMYSYHPVNITFMRWYYYDPSGLGYAPANYSIYADGTLIGTYNLTPSIDGQWVDVDIPDVSNIHTFKIVINSVISGSKAVISEIELFNNETPAVKQDAIPYYEGIPKWWNGLKWAISFRMDDVTSVTDAETGGWYTHMPITWATFTDSWTAPADPALVSQYHGEWAVHAHSSATTYHYPHWNTSYTTTYNEYNGTLGQVETTIANGSVSPWGSTCITIHYPMSGLNPNVTQALYDLGFRFGSYVGGAVKRAPAFNWKGHHWITYEDSTTVTTDNFPAGSQNMTVEYYNDTEPLNWADLLEISREAMARTTYDWAYYETVLESIRKNGSWTVINNHPSDTVPQGFWDFIANDTTGWHALEGEIACWYWYKWHTNVTLNASSNTTAKIYDINIHGNDNRIWHIPVTFAFNITATDINATNIYDKIKIRWVSNGTEYTSWKDNIGGFTVTYSQHRNQTMREGWRIDNNTLYLSFIPDGKQIVLYIPSNLPPTVSNIYPANNTQGVDINPNLTFTVTDANGDPMDVYIYTNASGSWQLFATLANATNGTYTVDTGNATFNSYNTWYWWSINVTDGTYWTNKTLSFKTRGLYEPSIPTSFIAAPYNCTSIALNWTKGTNADKTVIVMKTGGYPTNVTDGTLIYNGTSDGFWLFINNLAYNTTYYFSAWGWNETDSIYSAGYITANATTYKPPTKPILQSPANGSTGVERYVTLYWNCTDPQNAALTYDVYLGTNASNLTIVAHNISATSYDTGALSYNTTYYWKITAWNAYDGKNTSETWHFTTRAAPPINSVKNTNTGAWYPYIYDAIASATAGDTIAVYSNYTVDESEIVINKSVTIVGYGANISGYFNTEAPNITILNLTFTDSSFGIIASNNSLIENCTFEHNLYSIVANGKTTITNCTFESQSSIYLFAVLIEKGAENVTIENSYFTNNNYTDNFSPAWITSEGNNANIYILNNTFYARKMAFIKLNGTSNAVIEGNMIHNTYNSSLMNTIEITNSDNITIKSNRIYVEERALKIENTTNSLVYNNIFNASISNAYVVNSTVVWNISKTAGTNIIGGAYLGGNFWNDYTGVDADGDGIGDTAYNITFGNVDYLPLVSYNYPPTISNPNPPDNATGVNINTTLSVNISDQEGDTVTVSFYWSNGTHIGTVIINGNGTASVNVYNLSYNTQYFWYVTANDTHTNKTSATYSFTTKPYNTPPQVTLIYPPAGWTSVNINPELTFNITDIDDNASWVEVYRSTDGTNWTLISAGMLGNGTWSVSLGDSSYNTKFYWKVCATNDNVSWVNKTANFTTRELYEPSPPFNVSIYAYNATLAYYYFSKGEVADKTVIVMKTGGYPANASDGTVVYNGTQENTWLSLAGLNPATTYYFAFYSWNATGGLSDDAVLKNITTYALPEKPYNPSPANGSTGVAKDNVILSWNCTNPDANGFPIDHYEIYFGASANPAFVSNTTATSYNIGSLNYNTTYYWKIVAVNDHGDKSISDLWHFTTVSSPLPNPPANVNVTVGGYYWLNITWTPNPYAVTTYIRYDTINHTTWNLSTGYFLANTTATYFDHTGLSPHTTYYYALWSWNGEGYSLSYVTASGSIPNRLPTATAANPSGNITTSVNVHFSVYVSDPDGDTLQNVIIEISKDNGISWQVLKTYSNVPSGTTISFTETLTGGIHYLWHVYLNDGHDGVYVPSISTGWGFITNTPPEITNPFPANGATDVPVNISQLSAYISDADGDTFSWQIWIVTYVDENGTKYGYSANGTAETNGTKVCPITSSLEYGKIYIWYVNTTDGIDYSNTSFSFTTVSLNTPPAISSRLPANNAALHSPVTLSAYISDAEGDKINVSFQYNNSGTWTSLYTWSNAVSNQTFSYSWLVSVGSYQWRIVVDDGTNTVTSAVWNFTITPTNDPPYAPSNPSPADGATGVPLTVNLSWQCSDPNGDTLTYDIYFGETLSPPLYASGITTNYYTITGLSLTKTYYWKIVASDGNLTNESVVWHFTTRGETPPAIVAVSPANNSVNVSLNPTLSVTVEDNESDEMTIYIYTNASGTWSLLTSFSNKTNGAYNAYPSNMNNPNTKYWWKVAVYDGFQWTNATYSFTTLNITYNYIIEIYSEENQTLLPIAGNTTYTLVLFFDNYTLRYSLSSNPYYINISSQPKFARLIVNETKNNSFYRTIIPSGTTIRFYIPENTSLLHFYTFTLNDLTGIYHSPDSYISIYFFNETGKIIVEQDYWSTEFTANAYLIYGKKYFVDVVNSRSTYSAGSIEADIYTEKQVIIIPRTNIPTEMMWNIISYAVELNKTTNTLYFSYRDRDNETNYVNLSIYEYYNGEYNLTFQNVFYANQFQISVPANASRTYKIYLEIYHNELGTKTLPIMVFPKSSKFNVDAFEITMEKHLGKIVVSWTSLVLFFIALLAIFTTSPSHAGAGAVILGVIMAFFHMYLGFYISMPFIMVVIVVGALVELRNREVML